MKIKTSLSITLVLVAAGLFGMGTQGALYELAEDLGQKMDAWNKQCAGKEGDADCLLSLDALRKTAFEHAQFPADLAHEDGGDKTVDGTNGWKDSWRLYEQLFLYHGACFNRYDTAPCRADWTAFDKARERHWRLYGAEPRWEYFPNALKGRVFDAAKGVKIK